MAGCTVRRSTAIWPPGRIPCQNRKRKFVLDLHNPLFYEYPYETLSGPFLISATSFCVGTQG
jgi:hypothetical protein